MRRDELVGRILGMLVFLGGVGLLAFVFSTTYQFFNSAAGQIQGAPIKGAAAAATSQISQSALVLLVRIGLLIVMTIVGSLLAGRGIQLYFAASNAGRMPRRPSQNVEEEPVDG